MKIFRQAYIKGPVDVLMLAWMVDHLVQAVFKLLALHNSHTRGAFRFCLKCIHLAFGPAALGLLGIHGKSLMSILQLQHVLIQLWHVHLCTIYHLYTCIYCVHDIRMRISLASCFNTVWWYQEYII